MEGAALPAGDVGVGGDSDAEPVGEDGAQVETTHAFVPLGFEARTGAFGPRT